MAKQLEPTPEISPSAAVVSLPPASVSAVTVKIPPFWPADPQVWFAQVEAQFSMRNITSQRTKFNHVVAWLAPEFATEVRDLLLQPPADTPYDVLHAQLIKQTAASEQRRLRQLFTAEELGDRTPPNSCDDCSSYLVMQLDPTLTTRSSGNSSYNGFQDMSGWS